MRNNAHTTRIDDFEVEQEYPGIGKRILRSNARRMQPAGQQQMILVTFEDVTDEKHYMEDMRTHSALLELASDAILVRDLPGVIQLWNRGAERIYGWSKSEALGQPVYQLLKTKFPVPLAEIEQELARSGYWEGELIHTRKDGERRFIQSRWSLHREGNPLTILELNSDVTERKRAEERLRRLSAQIMQVQDEERRRIARDLHDSTGQKLIALKIGLEQQAAKKGDGRRSAQMAENEKLVDEAIREIRTLAQILHPPLLEEAGLVSAIRWLVDGFSSRSGIQVDINVPDGVGRLGSNVEIALFRIVQEALNNIHRHSGAKSARIEMEKGGASLVMKITDDGHGIQSDHSLQSTSPSLGVGLLGMRERLTQLGGTLTIYSNSHGTTVQAEVPVEIEQHS